MKDQFNVNIASTPRRIISESEVKDLKTEIKSCILAQKGGIPTSALREEYERLTGQEIPFLKFGYNSLFHLLRDIPEIVSSRNENNEPVLVVKPSSKTQHIHDLITKQKDPKTYRREPRKNLNGRKRLNFKRQDDRREAHDSNRQFSPEKKSAPVNENTRRPIIHTNYEFENNRSIYTEPVVGSHQLIGDDYFLQLCIKYLHVPLERDTLKSPITCGTVQSGLTIKKATKRLDKMSTMSNKLIINVGTVDIYSRRTDKEMIRDYKILLKKLSDKYGYSPNQITLCTLPPMGNVAISCEVNKYAHFASFNNWIRDFAVNHNYQLLDLHKAFTDDNMVLDYRYFQQDARMVSGTIHPHVLWNYFGRQKAMELLLNA